MLIIKNIVAKIVASGAFGYILAFLIFMIPGGLFYLIWERMKRNKTEQSKNA